MTGSCLTVPRPSASRLRCAEKRRSSFFSSSERLLQYLHTEVVLSHNISSKLRVGEWDGRPIKMPPPGLPRARTEVVLSDHCISKRRVLDWNRCPIKIPPHELSHARTEVVLSDDISSKRRVGEWDRRPIKILPHARTTL